MKKPLLFLGIVAFGVTACGTGQSPSPQPAAPSSLHSVAHETTLLDVQLSTQAIARLGISTTTVAMRPLTARRITSGEIIVPPGKQGGLPTTSTTNLNQIAIDQAAADGDVARALAAYKLAELAYKRAASLVREKAGSIRARDEAANNRAAAQATLDAARAKRALLGPAVKTMQGLPVLWVRVPTFASDIAIVAADQPVRVRALGSSGAAQLARPVAAPPAADYTAGTVDLFFSLDNTKARWRVGQRVQVELEMSTTAVQAQAETLAVPQSSIVRDIYGGEWVYVQIAPDRFRRSRIEVADSNASTAWLARGLAPGVSVVSSGVAELFGTEFGVSH